MRLNRVGLTWRRRILARLQRWWRVHVTRRGGHDLATVCYLRPDLFGVPFTAFATGGLRGPSRWTVGERELLATLVAQANQCPFCTIEHEVQARRDLERDVVDAVLAGRPHPGLAPRLRAALDLAVQLTRTSGEPAPAAAAAWRAAGLTDGDLADVVHVTAALNIASRVAESLGFEVRVGLQPESRPGHGRT
jgi:uncharacterized peroxidase-related enzyme